MEEVSTILSKKFRIHQYLPIHTLLWNIIVRDETPSRPGSVLVQKLCHVEYDEHISALDVFYEKDGRENRCIGEVSVGVGIEEKMPEISRERSELNDLVENWRYLNPVEGKIWKSDQMIVMDEK